MITGAARGLGLRMVEEIFNRNEVGSVKLYLIDIRADLIDRESHEALYGADNCTII